MAATLAMRTTSVPMTLNRDWLFWPLILLPLIAGVLSVSLLAGQTSVEWSQYPELAPTTSIGDRPAEG